VITSRSSRRPGLIFGRLGLAFSAIGNIIAQFVSRFH
jgi:hypothetical protein